jgi:UDP-GlcNAc:undecaprenyl-phosphate/decaprenyl-phosphate GlcNAc-1-phosphate transferase
MQESSMLVDCLVGTVTSAIAIVVLRRYAIWFGLVDHPSQRKQHVGDVPLVGGIAIFMGITVGAACYGHFHWFEKALIDTALLLTLLGALDDRFDLSVRDRLAIQVVSVLVVVASTGVYIHTLGHIFGHELTLGWLGPPLTVIAVIGLVNAFNMMDGIDGLAGSLELVCIAAIALFADPNALSGMLVLLALLAAASLPYLFANLALISNKVFLGDAGSTLIGYMLAWALIRMSQVPYAHLSPVDVLWCVALPVFDTLAVMGRRLQQGASPFKPDRGHIHHILMRAGLGPRATLTVLVALAAGFAFIGAVISRATSSAGLSLSAFILIMGAYDVIVTRAWRRQNEAHRTQVSPVREEAWPSVVATTATKPSPPA